MTSFSNVIAIIYPDGSGVSYSYDLNDRLITVADRVRHLTTYSYDTLNRPNLSKAAPLNI